MAISKRICEMDDFGNSIWYRLTCECGSDNHNCDLELSKDNEFDSLIYLTFYSNLLNKEKKFFKRIKNAIKLIFIGYIEMSGEVIMKEDQIDDFIEALKEGKEKVKNYEFKKRNESI